MTTVPKPPRDLWPWIHWGLFFIVVSVVALWMASKPASQVSVPVPARELPSYHIITANDIVIKSVSATQVLTTTVRDPQNLIGRYTREMLCAGNPVAEDQIVAIPDPLLISNTLAVAIPANSATIMGGNLRAGDVVSLAIVPASDTVTAPTLLFNALLVLDVKISAQDALVVLAIPADRWLEYLDKTRNAMVVLARRVE